MVNKLTDTVKPLDEINKINEIIDELDNVDALPSQTGQNGKFLTTDGTDASWGIPTSRNIGEIVQSSLPLIDAGLHLLDGALLSGDGIYSAFVDYIAGLVSTYPNLFVSESDWQSSVTNYGSCGKFVYDSTNNTVRLPKVSDILQGTTDASALGDLVQAGLPNITGSLDYLTSDGAPSGSGNGALRWNTATTYAKAQMISGTSAYDPTFDASRSSSIYKDNFNKVQPQTIKVLYYIVVATSTKTDIEVDIDEIATDLNGKLDIAGGTMTGVLNFNSDDYPSSTPSANSLYTPIYLKANNTIRGLIGLEYITDGRDEVVIQCRKIINGTEIYNNIGLGFDANGNAYFSFPKCTTKATTTSSAGDNKVAVIVQNYVNGTSWYRVWSDGWIEQGGRWNVNNAQDVTTTINLAKSFSNTNYTITLGAYQTAHDGSQESVYSEPSTTNFKLHVYGYHTKYVFWYACGY